MINIGLLIICVIAAFVAALFLRKASFKECIGYMALICGGLFLGSTGGYLIKSTAAKTSVFAEEVKIEELLTWYLAIYVFAKSFLIFRITPKLFRKIKNKIFEQETN